MTGTAYAVLAAGTLLLTANSGRKGNLLHLPSFRGACEVRSSLPGRLRLYVPAVSVQPQLAEETARQLLATGAVVQVERNERIGTLLLVYDETQVQAAVLEGAVIRLMGLTELVRRRPVSRLEEGLQTLYAAVNQGVLDMTDSLVDIPTIAGGALTVTALRRMLAGGGLGLPGTATLIWWATSLFGRGSHEFRG